MISAEEIEALRETVSRLLADRSTEADVRRAMETPQGYDADLWRQLAEMGLAGLVIGEAFGGSDAGPQALEAVMEEAGAALLCSPILAAVLAAGLVNGLGDETAKARLLPGVADGSRIVACALTDDGGLWAPGSIGVTAASGGDDWRLDGATSYVVQGQNADLLLVLAEAEDGLAVFEVDPASAGVFIAPLPTFDHTLRLARITFEAAVGVKLKAIRPVWEAVRAALDLALVALAGEQAGAARRWLDFTVDYAKSRVQFGRAIGSFQAIKHMAADLLVEVESATSAARNAAARFAEGGPSAEEATSLAAFACADAFTTVAATSIQMHGGIAFTWSHPAHLYLRRARADAQLFGAPQAHRERYLQALGG